MDGSTLLLGTTPMGERARRRRAGWLVVAGARPGVTAEPTSASAAADVT